MYAKAQWFAVALLLAGCASRQARYEENSRVSVSAPFVNVNVAEQGGVRVRAPFTDVDTTSRYQQPPSANTGSARFQPPGSIQQYNPNGAASPFQPFGSIAQPTQHRIPPANTITR